MSELITIDRADRRFLDYIRGTFSQQHRAIPVISQAIGPDRHEVVFEVHPIADLEKPKLSEVVLSALRWRYLTFSVSPIAVSLCFSLWAGWSIDPFLSVASILSVLLFQVSAHLLNDYYDHLRGVDHVRWRGSQIIQKGWAPAHSLQLGGWVCMILAVLCGVPALFKSPELILFVGVVALLGVMKFSAKKFGFKYRGLGEVALFVLTGPLLCGGLVWTVSSEFRSDILFLGCAFGLLTAVVYFLKNIEEMIVDESTHVNSLARKLGFDASKAWACRALLLLPVGFVSWGMFSAQGVLNSNPSIGGYWILAGICLIWPVRELIKTLGDVKSCLSSKVSKVREKGIRLHSLCGAIVALVFLLAHFVGQ